MENKGKNLSGESVGDKIVHALISLLVAAALSAPAVVTKQPALNVLPLAGVAALTSLFGSVSGVVCAVVTAVCSAYTLSEGNDFVSYLSDGLVGHIAIIFAAAVCVVFISRIRRLNRENAAQLASARASLAENGNELEEARTIDPVTQVKNRFAFRRDYETFKGRELCIMMLDVDNFKKSNDTFGHAVGDFILKKFGEAMRGAFSADYCYRYGGDEFLVVCPDMDMAGFEEKLGAFKSVVNSIALDNGNVGIRYSSGYVHGVSERTGDLRLMLRHADSNLYEAKNAGKDRDVGSEFSREFAAQLEIVPEEELEDLFGV